MPRLNTAIEYQVSDLDEALSEVKQYVRKCATGDVDSAFAETTAHGVLVGVGDSKFMLSPYMGGDSKTLTASGLYSFDQLKSRLPLTKTRAGNY